MRTVVKLLGGMGVLALLALAPSVPVGAQSSDSSSGNWLNEQCSSSSMFAQGLCNGFIGGVLAGVQADHAIAGHPSAICIRPAVTNGQIVAVVTKFLRDNPDIRDQDAGGITLIALVSAFPCPKAQ